MENKTETNVRKTKYIVASINVPVDLIYRLKSFIYNIISDDITLSEFLKLDVIIDYIKRYDLWCKTKIIGERPVLGFKKFEYGKISGLIILKIKDREMDSFIKSAYNRLVKHVKQYNGNHNTNTIPPSFEDLREHGLVDKLISGINRCIENSDELPSFLLIHKHLPYSIDNIFVGTMDELRSYLIALEDKYCGAGDHMVNKKEFKGDISKYDKLSSVCITCIQLKNRTKEGLLRRMYNRQVNSSIMREHPTPDYNKDWFTNWALGQTLYHDLHKKWIESNYHKNLTPSCDRINSNKPYLKDNIQLMTWKENNDKGSTVMIYRYSMAGKLDKAFESIRLAKKSVNGTSAIDYHTDNILNNNKYSVYKNFIWSRTKKDNIYE